MFFSTIAPIGERKVLMWTLMFAVLLAWFSPGGPTLLSIFLFAVTGLLAVNKEEEVEEEVRDYCKSKKITEFTPNITKHRIIILLASLTFSFEGGLTWALWETTQYQTAVKLLPVLIGFAIYVCSLVYMTRSIRAQKPS